MDGEGLWALMDAQGRKITWLAREASRWTPIAPRRLYHLKYAAFPRGPYLWRPDEMEAVSRALGQPQSTLFGTTQTVRGWCVACGRRRRLEQTTAQGQGAAAS